MLRRMGRSGIVPFSVRYLDDFIKCYPLGKVDIRGKSVVDIGCDWGSTPICWRANGASKVIGFEANPKSVKWLARLREEPWFDFRGLWTGDYPDADVLKMDCEGCEASLDISKLNRYGLWFVATHKQKPKPGRTQPLDTYGLDQQLLQLGGEKIYDGEWADESERVYRGGFLLK